MLVVESEVRGDTKDLNKLSFSESVKKFINIVKEKFPTELKAITKRCHLLYKDSPDKIQRVRSTLLEAYFEDNA